VRVLVTGHTGFKGSWLTLLLKERGHAVSGLALDPEPGSLFDKAELSELLADDIRCDIRDAEAVRSHVGRLQPQVVIHLAAQPLVRASYADPRGSVETNVMGTLSVLEAISGTPSIKGAVIVTTDKVYRNVNQQAGYDEGDALGGDDPYSASKAMADILVSSWTRSFDPCPVAIARAGNVIGGGDISADRLFPDIIRSFVNSEPVVLRYPDAVRPWQHVLDCLSGYVMLMDELVLGSGQGSWNFGPDAQSFRTVREATEFAIDLWPSDAGWQAPASEHLHEAHLLTLDSTKARRELGWSDRLNFEECVEWTLDWEKAVANGANAREVTVAQIAAFNARGGQSS
jgi:CDP-glucose 4,6-dehydratase